MSIHFLRFLKEWNSGKETFTIQTSGSTGEPKKIELNRRQLIYSAEETFKALGLNRLTKIYNCIPVDKIGGFMNWVRAVHLKLDIQTVNPTADPMQFISKSHNYTFISLVPYQLYAILKNEESVHKLNLFETVLIGGVGLNPSVLTKLKEMNPMFWESYGMTETCSHIGLRRVFETQFTPVGDIKIVPLEKGNVKVKGTVTSSKWIEVQDVLEVWKDGKFKIKGRVNNVINSGGIKLFPEEIEAKILEGNPSLRGNLICAGAEHVELGTQLVLFLESDFVHLDWSNLSSFEKPKQVQWNCKFAYTQNGKLKREETIIALKNVI